MFVQVTEAIDVDEQYGVTTPIEGHVQELATRYYCGLKVLQALDESKTVDKLAADLDLDATEVEERVTYLEEFNRITRDGEPVQLTE